MINNTDIFTRLDWLTNKVNRILGALQNGGGGGSQNINQVLATGATATDKTLLFNDTSGISTTATLKSTELKFINLDDAVATSIGAGGLLIQGAGNLEIAADRIIRQGAGTGSLQLTLEPSLFEVIRPISGINEIGLSLNFDTNVFGFGDTNSSAGLFINAANNLYKLGDFSSDGRGLDMDTNSGNYILGDQNGAQFAIFNASGNNTTMATKVAGTESGLGLFNNTGNYKLGDFGGTANPDTYGVYIDVSSAKANPSIKSYYNGYNKGLYIDHNAGIYGFRDEQYGNAYFGLGYSTLTGFPSLAMSTGLALAGGSFTFNSYIPINRGGTMYYIPVYT
jgi:hypothetical protein